MRGRLIYFWKHPSWQQERYHIIFTQLMERISSPDPHFPSSCIKLYELLTKSSTRHDYIRFIRALRKALIHTQPPAKDWLRTICAALYTLDLTPLCQKILKLLKEHGSPLRAFSHLELFPLTYQALFQCPQAFKQPPLARWIQILQSQLNCNFDPLLQDNTPYLLASLQYDNKIRQLLRLGTPTKEGYFATLTKKVKIIPEFLALIEGMEKKGQKHLYINLQQRHKGTLFKEERFRNRAIESLAKKYPATFSIISLPRNSAFYAQSISGDIRASDFKEELLKESTEDTFFFSMPFPLEQRKALIDATHITFFNNKPFLNKSERRIFIEIFYLEIIDYLILELDVDSLNITCRDGIDRAGMTNALFYLWRLLKTNTLTFEEWETIEAILFAPALLVKKRPIRKRRFERFLLTAQHLMDCGAMQKLL